MSFGSEPNRLSPDVPAFSVKYKKTNEKIILTRGINNNNNNQPDLSQS